MEAKAAARRLALHPTRSMTHYQLILELERLQFSLSFLLFLFLYFFFFFNRCKHQPMFMLGLWGKGGEQKRTEYLRTRGRTGRGGIGIVSKSPHSNSSQCSASPANFDSACDSFFCFCADSVCPLVRLHQPSLLDHLISTLFIVLCVVLCHSSYSSTSRLVINYYFWITHAIFTTERDLSSLVRPSP